MKNKYKEICFVSSTMIIFGAHQMLELSEVINDTPFPTKIEKMKKRSFSQFPILADHDYEILFDSSSSNYMMQQGASGNNRNRAIFEDPIS